MIARKRTKPRRSSRVHDPAYLDWIRGKDCVCCLMYRYNRVAVVPALTVSEAAHVGERGLGQKSSDRESLPLCVEHHRAGPKSHHTLGKRFWSTWEFDRAALVEMFNAKYREETGL